MPAFHLACYPFHMSRIWAKTIVNFKVKDSIIHECAERLDSYNFFENTREIAEKLHIATPVVLDSHCKNFLEFNTLKFKPRDFLEPVPFDSLVFESAD